MNVENVNFAIEVMKNAKNLQMTTFQHSSDGDEDYDGTVACTIDDLHRCGNTACFVGYLSLTDEYKKFVINTFKQNTNQDFKVDSDGTIIEDFYNEEDDDYFENSSEYYLSEFLGITNYTAHDFIFGDTIYGGFSNFYDMNFKQVKPEHVINKLELVLKGELV